MYQDAVIKVTDLKYSFKASPDTTTITFNMTKNGQPFDPKQADSLNIYFVPYAKGKFQFEPAAERLSLKGTISSDGKGLVTSTLVEKAAGDKDFVDYTDVSKVNGLIVIYGRDETVGRIPDTRLDQNKYPFAGLLETGAGVDYVSAANNAGCEKCHTDPYLKHGYIYGQVNDDPATDFYTCKACHLDNGEGGHFEWQLLVNDPPLAAKFLAGEVELTDGAEGGVRVSPVRHERRAHVARHGIPVSPVHGELRHLPRRQAGQDPGGRQLHDRDLQELPPRDRRQGRSQGRRRAGLRYDQAGPEDHRAPGDPRQHGSEQRRTAPPAMAKARRQPSFKKIHTGYDKAIYTADGMKYSDAISVTIESATLTGTKLNIKFSAAESPDIKGIDVAQHHADRAGRPVRLGHEGLHRRPARETD